MKAIIISSVILIVLAFAVPLFLAAENNKTQTIKETVGGEIYEKTDPAGLTYSQKNETSPEGTGAKDLALKVKILTGGEVKEMSAFEYLVGVVAAEMPASFEIEALKAQAVAARTYMLYRMLKEPAAGHPQAQVCDDVKCCSAYISQSGRKDKWGESYEQLEAKIESAVVGTDGLCLVYEGGPIFAAFHSSSAGYTEDSKNVFSADIPYLKSVFSPESEETVPNCRSSVTISFSELKKTAMAKYPKAVLSGVPEKWITDIERSFAGRILSLKLGGDKNYRNGFSVFIFPSARRKSKLRSVPIALLFLLWVTGTALG